MTITHKFRSLGWVAAVALAALACYLISFNVSAERLALEEVEADIAEARGDILALTTEFETRSRMSQLERWNRRAFVLSAPNAEQVLEGEIELASLLDPARPAASGDAGVQMASAGEDADGALDRFEPPAAEDPSAPRLQQATYLVPAAGSQLSRGQRIAFLDDSLRDEIAAQAEREQRTEDVRER